MAAAETDLRSDVAPVWRLLPGPCQESSAAIQADCRHMGRCQEHEPRAGAKDQSKYSPLTGGV